MRGVRTSRDDQIKEMTAKHSGFYGYDRWGHPTTSQKSTITCPIHGDFEQTYNCHYHQGKGCPKCANQKRSEASKKNWEDPEYLQAHLDYLEERWSDPEAKERLAEQSRERWKQAWYIEIMANVSRPNTQPHYKGFDSKWEYQIDEALRGLSISDHTSQFKIPGTAYRFDFYLPSHNLIIEFHGNQHKRGWGGKEKSLEAKQRNDSFKAQWARSQGIAMLVIEWKDRKNIHKILRQKLGHKKT